MIQLGEKIELKDFKEHLEPGEITILKKLIGNKANHLGDFKKLTIHLKEVHKKEKSQKFQINAQLDLDNKLYEVEATNFNLFFTVNDVLEKLKTEINRD